MKNLIIASMLLALVATASADMMLYRVGGDPEAAFEVYLTDPVPVGDGSEGLCSRTLYAVNVSGNPGRDLCAASGMAVAPISGETGCVTVGNLHNEQGVSGFPPVQSPSPYRDDVSSTVDTCWLIDRAATNIVCGQPLNEPVVPNNSAEYGDWGAYGTVTGFGEFLSGGWAFTDVEYQLLEIAQIITRCGETCPPDFAVEVQISDRSGYTGDFSCIPEPATLVLLGLGAVALIRRRR